ncbi:DUF6093 family protein [Streptomyces sp. 8L]|uniref:DUF6093 family protein n=1 Tax=Streptomyces sp. 8L TaxID=2877242 RepID=UPI001CD6BCFF|nr:DUF6093 family protein [Streptomyces sp. 8L]MCA1218697.1 DUF6093 family protein [Streptomyces sp. 8L]
MSAASTAAAGQRAALELMTDTCRVEEIGEVVTSDDGTDTPSVSLVYEGKCRIKPMAPEDSPRGQQDAAPAGTWQYTASLPLSATHVAYGQRLTVLTSLDPSLPGVAMNITTAIKGGQITARRLRCTEVSR